MENQAQLAYTRRHRTKSTAVLTRNERVLAKRMIRYSKRVSWDMISHYHLPIVDSAPPGPDQ
ncbi:hypothetical protein ACRALDRAFT_213507 [Sodiomyces alcalophilus JCM 7366]|uniref:uncharacterized protein n=1 Tax=Sodiomyces alcalophilus JCM 7366 TaxID=591952 RepID=UPI0039B68311